MNITHTKATLLLSFLMLFFIAKAQEKTEYIAGEVLVQLVANFQNIDMLIKQNQKFNGANTELALVEKLSESLNIWHLKFNAKQVEHTQFINHLALNKYVVEYQNNTTVALRSTTPNDTEFNQQWQYINPGGFGGIVGADIDADLAWDITTGGVTSLGDTIVVCIVDDGILETHEDLEENLWVNHGEIENNGIDDDNNGYIDDYRGFNANNTGASDLDEVYSPPGFWGVHGNAVAAVVGAKGNNALGVAGVNWDVKLMIVKNQGASQAQVIKAYEYPLTMRKLYNETNGAEGAFVVAVNSSWGINYGNPASYPLWCAFYDEMGQAGIINTGATANEDTNVDVEGDMPTGCSSNYLLTVTNVWRNDVKVNDAGYGLSTIDMGAFGEDAHTASQSSTTGYAGFGGTSGATPQVAGAIALLYAAPCPSFAGLYASDPAAAALKAKEYVINGGDDNVSLQNITVSGKRLNLNGMLTQLNIECSGCPLIESFDIVEIQDKKVFVEVQISGDENLIDFYEVRYREVGASSWLSTAGTSSPIIIDNLNAETNYQYQIKAVCDTSSSSYTASKIFTTNFLSINKLAIENGIKVYPNPTKDIVYITLDELQADFEILFYDISGKLIYSGNMLTQKKKIDISVLTTGIYILKLKDAKGNTFTHKITKL